MRSWQFLLPYPPADCWPLFADTARYNEVMGVPRHQVRDELQADGRVRFHGSARLGPFRLQWEDLPPNWVRNAWQEHLRRFSSGPLASLHAHLRLTPDQGGTRLEYTLAAAPRGLLGHALAGRVVHDTGARFEHLVAHAREFLAGNAARPFDYRPPRPPDAARARATMLADTLEAGPYGHGLARRLVAYLFESQEVDLARVRPIALARHWGVAVRDCVELALAAARAGLLQAQWQLLCPRCRVAKTQVAHLEQLPEEAHCSTCNIRYDRDYSRNVELSFAPAASIRVVERGEFCWLGPMNTPHIAAQLTLAPGESVAPAVALCAGRYRLRTLEAGPETDFDWAGDGFPALAVRDDAMLALEPGLAPGSVANTASALRTVIIEQRDWVRDALTADRVSTLQAFRDLFSDEVLRPGDDVAVAHVTFMFTDLAGSTALYQRLGDAGAYHQVREHFALLAGIVRRHDGGIVKTRGDGVHAAFAEPADALRAALAIQVALSEAAGDDALAGIRVRIGLHAGPSIAVTIDGRLDYYGTTVNTAARLEGQGEGGDIVLSAALAADPEVAQMLGDTRPQPLEVALKGLAGRHALWRLGPAEVLALARQPAAGVTADDGAQSASASARSSVRTSSSSL